jgi:hypothetical protein
VPEWPALAPFQAAIGIAAALVEACGVATILLGVALAFPGAVGAARRGSDDGGNGSGAGRVARCLWASNFWWPRT